MIIVYKMGREGPEEIGRVEGTHTSGNETTLSVMRGQMKRDLGREPSEEDWLKIYGKGTRLWASKPISVSDQVRKAVSAQIQRGEN